MLAMKSFIRLILIAFFLVLSFNIVTFAVDESKMVNTVGDFSNEVETTSLYQHLPVKEVEHFMNTKTPYKETCDRLLDSHVKNKEIPYFYADANSYKIKSSDSRIEVLRTVQHKNFNPTNHLTVFPSCSMAFEYERYGKKDILYYKERMDVLILQVDQSINIITGDYSISDINWIAEEEFDYTNARH